MLRTNNQTHSRGYHAEPSSNYLRFGSKAGKHRLKDTGAAAVVRLLAIYGGSARLLFFVVDLGCVLCTAVLV